mgnify:FL=1
MQRYQQKVIEWAKMRDVLLLEMILMVYSDLYRSHHTHSTERFARLQHENGHLYYPWKVRLYSQYLKKWQISLLVASFVILQLINNILYKGIMLFGSALSLGPKVNLLKDEFARDDNDDDDTNTSLASWRLCMTRPCSMMKHLDLQSGPEMPLFHGKGTFEEAWHVAEECLTEEIVSNCQGTYFLYNCLATEHEKKVAESSSMMFCKWNRDNDGRLIRQLWS